MDEETTTQGALYRDVIRPVMVRARDGVAKLEPVFEEDCTLPIGHRGEGVLCLATLAFLRPSGPGDDFWLNFKPVVALVPHEGAVEVRIDDLGTFPRSFVSAGSFPLNATADIVESIVRDAISALLSKQLRHAR